MLNSHRLKDVLLQFGDFEICYTNKNKKYNFRMAEYRTNDKAKKTGIFDFSHSYIDLWDKNTKRFFRVDVSDINYIDFGNDTRVLRQVDLCFIAVNQGFVDPIWNGSDNTGAYHWGQYTRKWALYDIDEEVRQRKIWFNNLSEKLRIAEKDKIEKEANKLDLKLKKEKEKTAKRIEKSKKKKSKLSSAIKKNKKDNGWDL